MQVFKQRTEQANTTFYVEGEGFGKEKRDQTKSLFSPHYMQATLRKTLLSLLY